jgi:hypothetical protein
MENTLSISNICAERLESTTERRAQDAATRWITQNDATLPIAYAGARSAQRGIWTWIRRAMARKAASLQVLVDNAAAQFPNAADTAPPQTKRVWPDNIGAKAIDQHFRYCPRRPHVSQTK